MKIKKVKKELKKIHENELFSLKINIFQKTIQTDIITLINKKHKIFEENFNEHVHTTEHKSIDLKVLIDSKRLLQDWNNKNKLFFSTDYIFNNYVSFEKNKETEAFFSDLELTFYLLGKNYISRKNIWIVKSWIFSFEQNEFIGGNKQSKEKDWIKIKKLDKEDEEHNWWLEKDTLQEEINNNFILNLRLNGSTSDNLVKELLFKGNQTIRIIYCKVNNTLTEKSYKYLNSGFWKNNWKWLLTSSISIIGIIMSIIMPIIIKIYWKENS